MYDSICNYFGAIIIPLNRTNRVLVRSNSILYDPLIRIERIGVTLLLHKFRRRCIDQMFNDANLETFLDDG